MGDFELCLSKWIEIFGERRARILCAYQDAVQSKRKIDVSMIRELTFDFELSSELIKNLVSGRAYQITQEIETAYFLFRKSRDQFSQVMGGLYGAHLLHVENDLRDSVVPILEAFFNFTSAAKLLVETYRRFRKSYDSNEVEYRDLLDTSFPDKGLASFVLKARDLLHHEALFHIAPTLRYNFTEKNEFSAAISVKGSSIANLGWNSQARDFINRSAEVDIVKVVSQYFEGAEAVFLKYKAVSGFSTDHEYLEIKKIEAARVFMSFRGSMGLVSQMRGDGKLRFFKWLAREFGPSEQKVIEFLISDPEAAADYMLSVRDPLGLHLADDRNRLADLIQRTFHS